MSDLQAPLHEKGLEFVYHNAQHGQLASALCHDPQHWLLKLLAAFILRMASARGVHAEPVAS